MGWPFGFIATVSLVFLATPLCDSLPNDRPQNNKTLDKIKSEQKIPPIGNSTRDVVNNEDRNETQQALQLKCPSKSMVDLVVVLDTSGFELDNFVQQRQLARYFLEGIRASWSNEMSRQLQVGLVSFAAEPSVVHSLANGSKIGDLMHSLESVEFKGRNALISLSEAVLLGLRQLKDFGREDALQVLVLISNGHGQEFLKDRQRWPWPGLQSVLKRLGAKDDVELFAASALYNYTSDELAIYTGDSNRVFVGLKHHNFVPTLTTHLNTCLAKSQQTRQTSRLVPPSEGLFKSMLLHNWKSQMENNWKSKMGTSKKKEPLEYKCSERSNLIDLLLVLDTTKVVYRTTAPIYTQKRQLATDLVAGIQAAWSNKVTHQLQIGLISFATEPSVVLSLTNGSDIGDVLDGIQSVTFKDRDTPLSIADAVELGLLELEKFGREDALQVILLVSDGHGQELLSSVQSASKRLRSKESIQVFAISPSPDYNLDELVLYTGDARRIFVGSEHLNFASTLSNHVNTCLARKPKSR